MIKLKLYYKYKYLLTFSSPVDILLIVQNTKFPYTKIKLSVSDFLCISDFLSTKDSNSCSYYSSIDNILKKIDEEGEALMHDILKYNIKKHQSKNKNNTDLKSMEDRVFNQASEYYMTKEDWKNLRNSLKNK